MLILTRKSGDIIDISDEDSGTHITITILSISNHTARIGVDAPDNITIHRREVTERIASNDLMMEKETKILSK
jgi:carbon storage regulator